MPRFSPDDSAGRYRPLVTRVILAGFLTAPGVAVFGQGNARPIRPQVYEIPRNGIFDSRTNKPKPSVAEGIRYGQPPASTRRAPTPRMRRRLLQLATQVDRTSANAFRRGLMDLDDFAVHQDVVLRLRLASQNNDGGDDRTSLLLAKIRRLDRAAERLGRLKQPGAAGWAASVAQARLMATNARIELALSRQNHSTTPILAERSVALAKQFYQLTKRDYDIGRADDRKMAKALAESVGKSKKRKPAGSFSQPSDRIREALAQRVARDKLLAQRPAGKTRPDNFAEARFQLAESQALAALVSGKTAESTAAAMHADRESRQQFQQLMRFSGNGTASLFDMTRAWLRRDDLQRTISRGGIDVPADMLQARKQDLLSLQNTATAMKDPRGRNMADVALVQSLQFLETAQPLIVRRETAQPIDGKPKVKPRIVDLTPLRKPGKPANNE